MSNIGYRLSSAILFALIAICLAYIALFIVGLDRNILVSPNCMAPIISAVIFGFFINRLPATELSVYFTKFVKSQAILRVLAVFVFSLVLWGLLHSCVDWAIGQNVVDHGPCSEFVSGFSCGSEDLNEIRRIEALQLIDAVFGIAFLIAPLALLNSRMTSWISKDV